jgi:hypothetical protein
MYEAEKAASRYDRDFLHQGHKTVPVAGQLVDERKARSLDNQSAERISRRYVDRSTGVSATGVSSPTLTTLYNHALVYPYNLA